MLTSHSCDENERNGVCVVCEPDIMRPQPREVEQLRVRVYRLEAVLASLRGLLEPPEEIQTVKELIDKVLSES